MKQMNEWSRKVSAHLYETSVVLAIVNHFFSEIVEAASDHNQISVKDPETGKVVLGRLEEEVVLPYDIANGLWHILTKLEKENLALYDNIEFV